MNVTGSSIVRQLVFVAVVVGVITGVVGALLVQIVERQNLLTDAEERNLANAVRAAALIDDRVASLEDQLSLVASQPSVSGLTDAAADDLAIALRVSDKLDRLVLYADDGEPLAGTAASSLIDVDQIPAWEPHDPDAARWARFDADLDRSAVEVAVAVEDPPGTRVGWLVGHAPVSLLTADVAGQLAGAGAHVGVLTADGVIVAHRDFDRVVSGEVLAVERVFPEGQRVATLDRNGTSIVAAAARLGSMPGWIVAEQTLSDALAPLQARTRSLTVVFLAVVLAVVVVVILAGRRLLDPLGPLADAVERVGAGEHGARVDARGSGEMAVLADGFNRMATSLEQRQDELRRAEISARRSEERLRLMVEGVEDYAIVLLRPDGTVRTWNTGARRLVGFAPREALGRPLSDVFDPDDPPPNPLVEVAETGSTRVEGWCRRSDGSRFWATISATSLQDDEGAQYGYAVILHDVTERRAAREAMEAALEREQQAANELRRANQLKDEFLGIAAHEIRTPLSVILGASRLLGRDGGRLSEEDASRVRAMIEIHADDMRAIVDRLLDFTRLQAGKVHLVPEPLDLHAELEAHVRSLGRHLEDHQVEFDVDQVTVHVDRSGLRHIVTNLISNAAKFSPTGTAVTVTGKVVDDTAIIAITDQGVGVPAQDQDLIFELFRQASHEVITARGTGVGLAIVKRYVELLDGEITVESAPGRGSTFTVRLPQPVATPIPEVEPLRSDDRADPREVRPIVPEA